MTRWLGVVTLLTLATLCGIVMAVVTDSVAVAGAVSFVAGVFVMDLIDRYEKREDDANDY